MSSQNSNQNPQQLIQFPDDSNIGMSPLILHSSNNNQNKNPNPIEDPKDLSNPMNTQEENNNLENPQNKQDQNQNKDYISEDKKVFSNVPESEGMISQKII